jgi:cation diffusion facilitator family transporter
MGEEMTDSSTLEQQALKLSIVGALGMAALGILFAALTGSEAVLLDGLFSLIAFAMGIFSLKVARLITKPDDEKFQLGYANFEPLVNTSKGLIMCFLCVYALYSAVVALFHGGRPISSGYALAYAVVAAVGCFAIALRQRKVSEKTHSPLVEVEAKGWLVDGLLSSAVCAAFIILLLIEKTSWSIYTPYADPLIVIVLVVLAAPIPVTILRQNLRELLLAAPEPDFQKKVRSKLKTATEGLPLETTILRMVKVGRSFYLQVYLVVSESHKTAAIEELDEVRGRITHAVRQVSPQVTIDVTFTLDAKWAQPFEKALTVS